jgi:hypothetical protein
VAVSPDGQNIVYVAGANAADQIWVRPVATLAARPIPGTEGGTFPFWSPDSRAIGFFAAGKLKKVQIAGGPPIVLCDAPDGRGGSWNRDNVILFTPSTNGGLLRVSSAGGVPTGATTLDPATGETSHRWPSFLPDGRHFLYTSSTGPCCPASKPALVRIGSLDPTDAAVTLFEGTESSVSYASGHLLFANVVEEVLMAQPFDADARQLKGTAFPLTDHITNGPHQLGGKPLRQCVRFGRRDAGVRAGRVTGKAVDLVRSRGSRHRHGWRQNTVHLTDFTGAFARRTTRSGRTRKGHSHKHRHLDYRPRQ